MASDRIEELKTVRFPTERRGGYDRRAVDAFLAELADWLETGGEDESRRAIVQQALGEVGERTGSILAAAQESADRLTAEAAATAERVRAEADQAAEKARSDAERDAAEVRSDADAYASETRAAADEHARVTAETAAEEAKRLTDEAEERLRTAEQEAAERTRGIEEEIAGLVRKRRDVVANLEQLNAEMRLAIEGPGERDLELPTRVEAAVETPAGEEEVAAEPEGEGPTVVSQAVERPAWVAGPGPDETEAAEAATEADTDPRDAGTAKLAGTDRGAGPENEPEPDTEERERRRRSVDSVDPPTEDSKLTELL